MPEHHTSGAEVNPLVDPLAPRRRTGTVDLNVMKRKMTIAKGFLDISLLSANANQLRNIINFGDKTDSLYYIVLTGIITSLVLQVTAGVILIVAERFDLNDMDQDDWSDTLNTTVVAIIFVVLLLNVIISSLGVDVADPAVHSTPPTVVSTSVINSPNKS